MFVQLFAPVFSRQLLSAPAPKPAVASDRGEDGMGVLCTAVG